MHVLNLLFSAAPIALLIYWMTKRKPMPSARALPLAALTAYVLQLVWFKAGPALVNASVLAGLLVAWTPILIVWGAIFFFRSMEATGAMDTIRNWLNHLSRNRVAQVILIGWSFQFLIEGASGFGTPAALAAPLLVGLGFSPFPVAVACLIFNTVPVSFGAVGAPTWFGFGQLGLTDSELGAIAWKTALIHCVAATFIPLFALRLLLGWEEIRRNLTFVFLALAASAGPMLALAWFNSEFPSVIGGLVGLVLTVWMIHHRIGLSHQDEASAAPEDSRRNNPPPPTRAVIKALFPIWATVLILLLTRIPQIGLRGFLTSATPAWEISFGPLGQFTVSPSLVLGLKDILGTHVSWSHQLLYVPSFIPFILISAISWSILSAPSGTARKVWRESLERMRNPVFALLGALVLVRLLAAGDERSPVMILGTSLATATGPTWKYLAAYLGALGSFFAGSNTISNLTFGPIQDSVATRMALDRTTVLALQSVGGAMGNMVAIHNIVAVCSVLGIKNQEGQILKMTLGPMLLYGLAAALVAIFI